MDSTPVTSSNDLYSSGETKPPSNESGGDIRGSFVIEYSSTGEEEITHLPPFFTGASGGIILPPYYESSSTPTLESRLKRLGKFRPQIVEPFLFPLKKVASTVFNVTHKKTSLGSSKLSWFMVRSKRFIF